MATIILKLSDWFDLPVLRQLPINCRSALDYRSSKVVLPKRTATQWSTFCLAITPPRIKVIDVFSFQMLICFERRSILFDN